MLGQIRGGAQACSHLMEMLRLQRSVLTSRLKITLKVFMVVTSCMAQLCNFVLPKIVVTDLHIVTRVSHN